MLDHLDPEARLQNMIARLPRDQRYEVTTHDPPYEFTLQLVGPPGMVDGGFVGWRGVTAIEQPGGWNR